MIGFSSALVEVRFPPMESGGLLNVGSDWTCFHRLNIAVEMPCRVSCTKTSVHQPLVSADLGRLASIRALLPSPDTRACRTNRARPKDSIRRSSFREKSFQDRHTRGIFKVSRMDKKETMFLPSMHHRKRSRPLGQGLGQSCRFRLRRGRTFLLFLVRRRHGKATAHEAWSHSSVLRLNFSWRWWSFCQFPGRNRLIRCKDKKKGRRKKNNQGARLLERGRVKKKMPAVAIR
mmetsp:Transcript_19104/g.44984  ORF Transcript_19104/g.44984 Transcript_19104/m.44984 type:complete len:232 (-) Transcript_19104:11-706(-)